MQLKELATKPHAHNSKPKIRLAFVVPPKRDVTRPNKEVEVGVHKLSREGITTLIVTQLLPHVIQGRIITGNGIAADPVWIPRMCRRQFPATLAFAMTINKSQGQTLQNVGLFLPRPVFSHGQLYVALSRVKSRSGLKILIRDKQGKLQTKTMNVVYKQVFQNIS
ncbi:BnaCnng11610D [Brassica napus]|uniref:BnaCnng11610D protein n=1 Tax=Brassica napus TaxID=3708 RepID=A0A078I3J8_BRANA|nr:BnaCnng11610D [Brassica napus]